MSRHVFLLSLKYIVPLVIVQRSIDWHPYDNQSIEYRSFQKLIINDFLFLKLAQNLYCGY